MASIDIDLLRELQERYDLDLDDILSYDENPYLHAVMILERDGTPWEKLHELTLPNPLGYYHPWWVEVWSCNDVLGALLFLYTNGYHVRIHAQADADCDSETIIQEATPRKEEAPE